MQSIKRAYVSAMHGFGAGLYGSGLLTREMPAPGRDVARWLHSLFAIYDIEAMVRLDLPWWTLEATRLVERHLAARPGARVFEYGAGASSVFLARRAREVVSVEHDPQWHDVVARKLAAQPNARLELVQAPATNAGNGYRSRHPAWTGRDFSDYVHSIDREDGLFDLIVIDGRCRTHCLNAALRRVKVDGIILFDNAGRRRYRAALDSCRLPRLTTSGLTACLPYSDPTMLLSPTSGVLTRLAAGLGQVE
jgi:hypothetical protein